MTLRVAEAHKGGAIDAIVAQARSVTDRIGVTRAVPITAFDRIGVPVWTTVRPSSRHLIVNGGKGLDDSAAEISARLECLEQAVAERTPADTVLLTLAEAMEIDPHVIDYVRTPLFAGNQLRLDTACHWITVTYLPNGQSGLAPVEAVHFPPPSGLRPLVPASSTRGLACGTRLEDAVVHGLLEVIERHAASLVRIGALDTMRLETEAGQRATSPSDAWMIVRDLEGRIRSASVVPVVRVAVLGRFWFAAAQLTDGERPEAKFRNGGYGLHPDPAHAVTAALLEAVQSRATWIHGTRDDLPETSPEAGFAFHGHHPGAAQDPFAEGPTVQIADLPSVGTAPNDLEGVVDGLSDLGLPAAYHRFGGDHGPFHVVRSVVPGSEDFSAHHPLVGRRLVAALRDRWNLGASRAEGA
ncbi:YcaO-like family protein [Polymorphospora rubra]|uniref:YcaO domain-containing protein n=1 Tax=Polymorphospora rubra TaxID=338584 RepID=A0A810N1Y2_9ACTN|nr:YcaO-like family protein [Polymorphospora rubra]BCJ65708.1 hypothetical protein Prubr_27290 [Polymorphospora rubra]